MPKTDEQYTIFAQDIENNILKLCQSRQSDTSVDKNEFHQKYKAHVKQKCELDIRARIYDYMSNHPSWRNRLDGLKFMNVLDECLRQYQPQGKFFLNFFLNRYQLRMQDTLHGDSNAASRNSYQTTMPDSYIDQKDSLFPNAESIDINTNNDEESTNKISSLDKQSVQDYKEAEIDKETDTVWLLYQKASSILSAKDLNCLRYFFTLTALSSDQPQSKADCEYLDKDIFLKQLERTPQYLQDYEQEKAASGKNIQKNAFLKAKYMTAIAEASDMKQDTLRKKFKMLQNALTEIGTQLHMAKK